MRYDFVEALIERCVAAGIEAQRAHAEAQAIRGEAIARHAALTPEESARLAPLEAAAERLSRGYLDAQRRLADANRVRFRERIGEVTHRIAERLR